MRKFEILAFAAIACLPLFGQAAFAGCATRHFYNKSDAPFTIEFSGSTGRCNVGAQPMSGKCVIGPGESAELHYSDLGGTIYLSSDRYYGRAAFTVSMTCYIDHTGRTGNVAVNEPANGDVSTCEKSTCK